MSDCGCGNCGCNPCQCSCPCDPSKEPLASIVQNQVVQLFGSVTKSCVDGKVVWVLPCDLDTGLPGVPRIAGEGILCYFMRVFTSCGYTGTLDVVTSVDWNSPILTKTSKSLTFQNGLLCSVGSPTTTTITTAEACP